MIRLIIAVGVIGTLIGIGIVTLLPKDDPAELQKQLDENASTIAVHDETLKEHGTRIAEHDSTLTEHATRIASAEETGKAHESAIGSLEEGNTEQDEKIKVQEAETKRLNAELARIRAEVARIDEARKATEAKLKDTQAQIEVLRERIDKNDGDIGALKTELDAALEQQGKLRAENEQRQKEFDERLRLIEQTLALLPPPGD